MFLGVEGFWGCFLEVFMAWASEGQQAQSLGVEGLGFGFRSLRA